MASSKDTLQSRAQERTQTRPFARKAAALLLASSALVSCGTSSNETIAFTPSPETATDALPVCAIDGQPKNKEERMCRDRRIGEIAIIAIPELETTTPMIDLSPQSTDALRSTEYAVQVLRLATDGAIDLAPKLVPATEQAVKDMQARNEDGCIDIDTSSNLLGYLAQKNMPELAQYEQVVVIGGAACKRNDGIVGGIANYTKKNDVADVYNETHPTGIQLGDATPINKMGGVIAHELLHSYGLNHSGVAWPNDYEAGSKILDSVNDIVDLQSYLNLPADYSEYGSIGNVMSSKMWPVEPNAQHLTDVMLSPVQTNFLNEAINPNDTPLVPALTRIHDKATVDPRKPAFTQGASIILDNERSIGGHTFTDINFVPEWGDGEVSLRLTLSSSATNGELFTTADVGVREITPDEEVRFRIGNDTTVVATMTNNIVSFRLK